MAEIPVSERVQCVLNALQRAYPNPKTELNYENEMQLVLAVLLSAQTTDKKVNQVTPALFEKYPTWQDLAAADVSDLETLIHDVNFYKTKARRIKALAIQIISVFDGKVPESLDSLISLPGIARKSANVIMHELWDMAEGIAVDTHVSRVSNRLGLVHTKDVKKIEQELMRIIPKEKWRHFHSAMVLHGRYICTARNPKCDECCLRTCCASASALSD